MSGRPVAFDFYCCEGGVSRGLERAGFEVYGVDLFKHKDPQGRTVGFSQSRYPYPSWQGDALEALDRLLAGEALEFTNGRRLGLAEARLATGSPPCQHASAGTRTLRAAGDDRYPELIPATRERFKATGLPYVIENVEGADVDNPLLLCWSMFYAPGSVTNADGIPLRMERHRLFESNLFLMAPGPCHHPRGVQVAGSYGAAQRTIAGAKARSGGYVPPADVQARLLGVDGMTEAGMHQCIPPAYAEHIGAQVLDHIGAAA